MKRNLLGFTAFVVMCFVLLVYMDYAFSKISYIDGFRHEAVLPSVQQTKRALLYISPAPIGFIVTMMLYIKLKFKSYFKFIYPISVILIYFICHGIGLAFCGKAIGWYSLVLFFPTVLILVVAFVFGLRRDILDKKEVLK